MALDWFRTELIYLERSKGKLALRIKYTNCACYAKTSHS